MQVIAIAINSGLIEFPTGYDLAWQSGNVSIWQPKAPAGYAPIGCLFSVGSEPPPLSAVVCVHQKASVLREEAKLSRLLCQVIAVMAAPGSKSIQCALARLLREGCDALKGVVSGCRDAMQPFSKSTVLPQALVKTVPGPCVKLVVPDEETDASSSRAPAQDLWCVGNSAATFVLASSGEHRAGTVLPFASDVCTLASCCSISCWVTAESCLHAWTGTVLDIRSPLGVAPAALPGSLQVAAAGRPPASPPLGQTALRRTSIVSGMPVPCSVPAEYRKSSQSNPQLGSSSNHRTCRSLLMSTACLCNRKARGGADQYLSCDCSPSVILLCRDASRAVIPRRTSEFKSSTAASSGSEQLWPATARRRSWFHRPLIFSAYGRTGMHAAEPGRALASGGPTRSPATVRSVRLKMTLVARLARCWTTLHLSCNGNARPWFQNC